MPQTQSHYHLIQSRLVRHFRQIQVGRHPQQVPPREDLTLGSPEQRLSLCLSWPVRLVVSLGTNALRLDMCLHSLRVPFERSWCYPEEFRR